MQQLNNDDSDMLDSLENIFEANTDEYNLALSIFILLTHRIRNEIMPEVEDFLGRRFKKFLIIPRTLNDSEKFIVMGTLSQRPLLNSVYDIKEIYREEGKKPEVINSNLIQLFSSVYKNIQNEVMEVEKAESVAPGQGFFVSMNNICKCLNCDGNLFLAAELAELVVDKSTNIQVETVRPLCECHKEDRIKFIKHCIIGKKEKNKEGYSAKING